MDDTDLKKVLNECKKSAKTGYKIASAQEKNLNARPKTENAYVFLRLRRPYGRLNSRTPAANIMLLYQSEGFHHQSGDGKSFHAFRRTMGTRLIKADIPLTTVSQVLGHTNLDSTKRYLYLHDEKLMACCMDLSKYPCRKEGLV